MDIEELRRHINSFSFEKCKNGDQGFNRILIQLFGFLGHGKSAFINTCIYVLEDGEYQNWAKAKEDYAGSTLERIPYKLTSNITLVDNRGLSKMDGYETGEIFAQLGNLLPLGKVEWAKGFELNDRITRAEKSMITSDFIFPVFVHSVKNSIPEEEQKNIQKVLLKCRDLTGVSPIVVLTHKNSGKLTDTENVFRNMGAERIFSFENYTKEDHFKTRGRHEEVLKFLHEVIKDVHFRIEHQPHDPIKEIIERKNFVITYIHNCEKKAQQENIEKKRAMAKIQQEKKISEQEEEIRREREKRRQEQAMELEMKKEELERQRRREQERQNHELQAAQEKQKKKKGKWKFF
ncbi:uncharacterized protein [Pyxicephalus adspersus]|uniref:uncharacterized protein n=1 Tax=Pyxicephalus adspersus TaxID=30357 RepID=UPI003B592E58